jgi:hypothetical protein
MTPMKERQPAARFLEAHTCKKLCNRTHHSRPTWPLLTKTRSKFVEATRPESFLLQVCSKALSFSLFQRFIFKKVEQTPACERQHVAGGCRRLTNRRKRQHLAQLRGLHDWLATSGNPRPTLTTRSIGRSGAYPQHLRSESEGQIVTDLGTSENVRVEPDVYIAYIGVLLTLVVLDATSRSASFSPS